MRCIACAKGFRPRRKDNRYCSGACRQRARRARRELGNLDQQIEEARHRYWALIQMKAEATGGNRSRIVTDEAQLVDEEGNVFMKGKHVGKVKPDPHREGWSMWGIEAAGPPFSAPPAATDRSRVVAHLKTEGKKRSRNEKRSCARDTTTRV